MSTSTGGTAEREKTLVFSGTGGSIAECLSAGTLVPLELHLSAGPSRVQRVSLELLPLFSTSCYSTRTMTSLGKKKAFILLVEACSNLKRRRRAWEVSLNSSGRGARVEIPLWPC